MVDERRRDQLVSNLAAVRERIAAACALAGRSTGEITLIAVTKNHPASDVLALAELGVLDIGENRDQEASAKAAAVALINPAVRWHFIGALQRNKCRSVVRYAHVVQSVDRVRLVDALDRAAAAYLDHPLEVLVQVSIDGDPDREGARLSGSADADAELDRVLARVADSPGLVLRGLMAMAPLDWEPDRAFGVLAEIADRIRGEYPGASVLSAGMSGDIEDAIRHGATHVRVGTALLGNRPHLM